MPKYKKSIIKQEESREKHIHAIISKSLFENFSKACITHGTSKQEVLQVVIEYVCNEDPRIIDLLKEAIEIKKKDPNQLSKYDINDLRRLLTSNDDLDI